MLNDNFILNKKTSQVNNMGTTYTVLPTEIRYTRITNRNKAIIFGVVSVLVLIVMFSIVSSIFSNSVNNNSVAGEKIIESVNDIDEKSSQDEISPDSIEKNDEISVKMVDTFAESNEAVFNAVICVKKIDCSKGQVPEEKTVFYNNEYPKDVYKDVYLL